MSDTLEQRTAACVIELVQTIRKDGNWSRAQNVISEAISAAVAAERARCVELVDRCWSFNNQQGHTHTWHEKQDCLAEMRQKGGR